MGHTWVGRALRIGAVALVASWCGAGVALAGNDYVPDGANDRWTYRNSRFGGEVTVAIDRTSGGWDHFTEFAGLGPSWVWTGTGHNWTYLWNGTTYELLTNFDARVGFSSSITIGCNRGRVTLAGRGETVQVPAGTFADCVRLELQTSCADAGTTAIWFAPGVGIVKWSEQNIAGPVDWVLVRAEVGGRTYPQQSGQGGGLVISGSFSATQLYVNRMPGTGPRPAPELTVSLEITNRSAQPLRFTFHSGQTYEIELLDAQGQVVTRWSDGRYFTQAIRTLELRPGESWSFTDRLAVSVPAAGQYTARMRLTADKQVMVASPLQVDFVY
ncbi:MAG: hypothetical protein KatS3mg102_2100 [Planctomycetota bacterium]|nr:MAG: hypothetical protein KatS3mg102_2100 [Planctomycetota bacterium]